MVSYFEPTSILPFDGYYEYMSFAPLAAIRVDSLTRLSHVLSSEGFRTILVANI